MSIATLLGLVARICAATASRPPDGKACLPRRCCAVRLLKQYRQLSYQELAFHLEDSASFRAFARLPWSWSPKKSVLQKTISAIRAETWEADQSDTAGERPAGEAGGRQRRAAGQHGHCSADARAERQQPALGRRTGDGAPVEAGRCLDRRHRLRLARSLPRGQEACPRDPVHPRATQTGSALPRADQDHPHDLGLSAAGGGAIGRGDAPRRRHSGRPRSATISR